jgi:hypothetical protein
MLPWMARNMALTGNPVFGLRGMEVWMNTRGFYPGDSAYRQFPSEIIPGGGVFKAVLQKVLLGLSQIIRAFPEITASWILAFFLPCLLFRFSDAAANTLRRVMVLCLLGLVVGSVLFRIQMPLFVAVVPTMLVFSVAYLVHLTQQAKLRTASLAVVGALTAFVIGLPLVTDMVLTDKVPRLKEAEPAQALTGMLRPDEVVMSDQPWIVAWYADRPAVWIPVNDSRVSEVRSKFPKARWLFMTERSRALSPQWASIYDVFARWNGAYAQAAADNRTINSVSVTRGGAPILDGLRGFTSVPPAKDATPSVVIATVPDTEQRVGMQTGSGGPVSR